jgi:predicted kinase
MYRKTRKKFLEIAKLHNAQTIALVFEIKKETLLERNKKRGEAGGRNVPEDVIDRMLERYECPGTDEVDKVNMVCYIKS